MSWAWSCYELGLDLSGAGFGAAMSWVWSCYELGSNGAAPADSKKKS